MRDDSLASFPYRACKALLHWQYKIIHLGH